MTVNNLPYTCTVPAIVAILCLQDTPVQTDGGLYLQWRGTWGNTHPIVQSAFNTLDPVTLTDVALTMQGFHLSREVIEEVSYWTKTEGGMKWTLGYDSSARVISVEVECMNPDWDGSPSEPEEAEPAAAPEPLITTTERQTAHAKAVEALLGKREDAESDRVLRTAGRQSTVFYMLLEACQQWGVPQEYVEAEVLKAHHTLQSLLAPLSPVQDYVVLIARSFTQLQDAYMTGRDLSDFSL